MGTRRKLSKPDEAVAAPQPLRPAIPDLTFAIESAEALRYAASPHIAFKLRVTNADAVPVHSVLLKCQLQLDVTRRPYNGDEQDRLIDLFGPPEQWPETLRGLHWANVNTVVTPFTAATVVDLAVPCTLDFNAAPTKYFAGLRNGEVPVTFLFSGTVFYANAALGLQVTQIPWEKEASFRLPVTVWQDMIDLYYPDSVWLCLKRSAFERLNVFKTRRGLPTFEDAIEAMVL